MFWGGGCCFTHGMCSLQSVKSTCQTNFQKFNVIFYGLFLMQVQIFGSILDIKDKHYSDIWRR